MKDEIKEILEDYKKLAGEITEKLDNTAEYESWLIVQDYFDKLLDYITNLQDRINKAIEYIDNRCLDEYGYVGYGDDLKPRRLVNILKGEDKDE